MSIEAGRIAAELQDIAKRTAPGPVRDRLTRAASAVLKLGGGDAEELDGLRAEVARLSGDLEAERETARIFAETLEGERAMRGDLVERAAMAEAAEAAARADRDAVIGELDRARAELSAARA